MHAVSPALMLSVWSSLMFVLISKVAGKLTKDVVTQTSNLGVREAEAGGF